MDGETLAIWTTGNRRSSPFDFAQGRQFTLRLRSGQAVHRLALATANNRFDDFRITRKRLSWVSRGVLAFLLIISLSATSFSLFVPQTQATNPTDTKWYMRDQNVGGEQRDKAIFCPTATDCKIVYRDGTNQDLKFIDCDDATCSVSTTTTVDSTGNVGIDPSIYCIETSPGAGDASSNCKIAYRDVTNSNLILYDCDNAICSSGTRTVVDGSTSNVGTQTSIYCISDSDCKISYRDIGNTDLKMADCDNSTCSTVTVTAVDSGAQDVGVQTSIFCIATDNCKITYRDVGSTALKFADCANSSCSSGTTLAVVDGDTGCSLTDCSTALTVGFGNSMYCLSNTSCKIAYYDQGNTALLLADCTNDVCTTGSVEILDGEAGCVLTGCSTTTAQGNSNSIYCPTASDCKIAYYDPANKALRMADCDSADCNTGTTTLLDGAAGCSLTNCTTSAIGSSTVTTQNSIYCISSTDCKISYYDVNLTNLKFADCDNADDGAGSTGNCDSGTTITIDGDKKINATLGAVTTTQTFGSTAGQTYTLVSDVEYPTGDDNGSLGTGTYTLDLNFTNGITSGTLTWNYEVGYCTISSDCSSKTTHVTSANQNFTSATTSPQSITVVAGSSLTIPTPKESKWLYIELEVVTAATGTITINMNNTDAAGADTNIDIPALTVPEFIGFLVPAAPFLPKVVRNFRAKWNRWRRRRRVKGTWKQKL